MYKKRMFQNENDLASLRLSTLYVMCVPVFLRYISGRRRAAEVRWRVVEII
jgi:hypothetical protein